MAAQPARLSVRADEQEVADARGIAIESVPIPTSFKCPITHDVLQHPVVTHDGQVYEQSAIQEWFRRGHRTSPVTGIELPSLALTPETPLRRAIEEYMCARPEIASAKLELLSVQHAAELLEAELLEKANNPQEETVNSVRSVERSALGLSSGLPAFSSGYTQDPNGLLARQAEEKDFMRAHDTSDCSEWYILDTFWLTAWKQFVCGLGPPPGAIDNSRLVSSSGQAMPGLRAVDDYRGVNGTIWGFWYGRYGGGPTIRRTTMDVYGPQ